MKREDWWRPGAGWHEITFAIELLSARLELYEGPREDADDWKAAHQLQGTTWLTGTIDWLHWGSETTLPWVDDLKTGHWPVLARKSAQLRTYALPGWIRAGMPLRYQAVLSITQWEKYPLSAPPVRNVCRVNGLDLMEHLEALRHSVQHPSEVVVTDACTFCPCRVQEGVWAWLSPWKYNTSCWGGLASIAKKEI